MRYIPCILAVVVSASVIAACGGDDDGDRASAGKAEPLTAAAAKTAAGDVTFCVGKDTTGSIAESISAFNARGDVEAELLELPEAQDEARAQVVQRMQARSPECDVIGMDPTQIAEFAAQGWLKDLTAVVGPIADQYIASTVESARYDGRYWGLPYVSDAGFLYYRSDKLDAAPTTWQEVYAQARERGGYVYQGSRYEGLTVHFIEQLYSAGGEVLTADGKASAIDDRPARDVLELMKQGLDDGSVPKAVVTYAEEEARRAFENDRAVIQRNWPYAYALGQKSAIKGKFEVAPLAGWEGGEPVGILGGYDLGISAYSENPGGALAFALFMGGADAQRIAGERSFPPTRVETYDDPAVREVLPFADTLEQAVATARPRPATPVYPQISEAISRHAHAALVGDESVEEAVQGMHADIEEALATF